MKKKSCEKLTYKVLPAKNNAAPSAGAEKPSEEPILVVPECDSSGETASFCDYLLAALAGAPQSLTLRFISPHQMPPDSALIVYDILTTRGQVETLITEAWSPVLGPSLLVWLAGEKRRMRPTTYFHFHSLQKFLRCSPRFPWDDDFGSIPDEAEPEVNLRATDYEMVVRLMDQYLPVTQVAGKVITPAMLRGMGLLEDSPLDELLQKFLARDASGGTTLT